MLRHLHVLPSPETTSSASDEKSARNVSIAVVIPCYREKAHILDVLARISPEVAAIYVVGDCCPEHTGDLVATECHVTASGSSD